MTALETAFAVFDYAAVAVFAATGALAAARRRDDIVTFAFFAAITGVGGGTLRDVLIDAPVFWIDSPGYLIVCLGVAVAVWMVGGRGWRMGALLWLDAVGMAAYAVVGAAKALSLGVHPIPATVMGVLTAAFGGIIRDVLAGEPSVLLRREIYVTAGLVAGGVGFVAGFALRAGALRWGWTLPAFGKAS